MPPVRHPYELPQPRLFSFNNPFGACPTCHGFGNTIELDLDLVVPDPAQVDRAGRDRAVDEAALPALPDGTEARGEDATGISLDVPWVDLTEEERRFVVEGDGAYEGIRGFFAWLERKKYKVHVRVFLSRYRGYQPCPDCGGARLRREARDVRVGGGTMDVVCARTVKEAAAFFDALALGERDGPSRRRCCARSRGACRSCATSASTT